MVNFLKKEKYGISDLIEIMRILRSDEGCPWDREQTHESIRMNFIEETYEACEAIDNKDPVLLCEELGDVLAQVVFHSEIERDAGRFDIDDVADGVCKKFILRHPHVFGDCTVKDSAEVLKNWDDIKRREKKQGTHYSAMDSVARSLPSLMRADKLHGKAKKAGVPQESLETLVDKITDKLHAGNGIDMGDVLFDILKIARMLDVNPEQALYERCERFISEFGILEKEAEESGNPLENLLRQNADRL